MNKLTLISICHYGGGLCVLALRFALCLAKVMTLNTSMATLEEIKELLRGETRPINSKLDNLSANFEDLNRTVQFLSAKYDQLLAQVKQTNRSYTNTLY